MIKNNSKIQQLQLKMKELELDYFLFVNNNKFFCEYLPESDKFIEYLTGFTGSNAYLIVTAQKSFLFTDGRYILQAQQELDKDYFEIINIAHQNIFDFVAKNLKSQQSLALNGDHINIVNQQKLQKIADNNNFKLVIFDNNLVEDSWHNRPKAPASIPYHCLINASGESSLSKRVKIMSQINASALLITKPENLCWLLNIRASDLEFTPILLCFAILFADGKVILLIEESRQEAIMKAINFNCEDARNLEISSFSNIENIFRKINSLDLSLAVDGSALNYNLYQKIKSIFSKPSSLLEVGNVIEKIKNIKNKAEINGSLMVHNIDGIAVTKFLFWFEKMWQNNQYIDELTAEAKLLEFRSQSPYFKSLSFATISGFAGNGAIVHYRANQKTNLQIKPSSLFLIDSGGQYFSDDIMATTDITRTILVGQASEDMINNFTRVAKGHINLARARFPINHSPAQLDGIARYNLWLDGKDYDHGTGHGVGSFLGVHEAPASISRYNPQPLVEGLIISNEPGFYLANNYGIRIENLMLVESCNQNFLQFRTLTMVPIDYNLLDFKMLTYPEKKWLANYHQLILANISDGLNNEELQWLEAIANFYIKML